VKIENCENLNKVCEPRKIFLKLWHSTLETKLPEQIRNVIVLELITTYFILVPLVLSFNRIINHCLIWLTTIAGSQNQKYLSYIWIKNWDMTKQINFFVLFLTSHIIFCIVTYVQKCFSLSFNYGDWRFIIHTFPFETYLENQINYWEAVKYCFVTLCGMKGSVLHTHIFL